MYEVTYMYPPHFGSLQPAQQRARRACSTDMRTSAENAIGSQTTFLCGRAAHRLHRGKMAVLLGHCAESYGLGLATWTGSSRITALGSV